ncbi:hypothetical protein BU24DRAFT_284498 [Aaosphaeria arxii CBS 175.79]|uniref:Zn(2)-C6 fungal-type domain-containing protein n=1 Tax=Aaosphaeria arxii CBS 175.79 TaxID=1450172 RepID=A0A6A5XF80_9PLEO|nr:uncharacterized protein BU24DRAFT_284498 [Aaosphaeria arxii CBS 175.79]KAF2011593.1 hypothetical protein BU24DRAFT_284498 [Aaosphaeria arxii CBS 175.79]
MSENGSAMENDAGSPGELQQPPAKRQRTRTLACRRCRQRKQKCEESRPCSNCTKGGYDCLPTAPAPKSSAVESEYVRVLEERIAELESLDPQQSLDHIPPQALQNERPAEDHERQQIVVDRSPIGSHSNGNVHELHVTGLEPSHRRPSGTTTHRRSSGTMATNQRPSGIMAHRRPSGTMTQRRPSGTMTESSLSNAFTDGEDEDTHQDHLILGLVASPSAPCADLSLPVLDTSPATSPAFHPDQDYPPLSQVINVPMEVERLLLEAYRDRAQAQYPFFLWDSFLSWHADWKSCPRNELRDRAWQGFFTNLVYATSLLLLRRAHVGRADARSFYRNGISLLPSVLEKPNKILHVQAYLLLAMNALHQSSTERIISLTSTTMRACVQHQLHLTEWEAEPHAFSGHLSIQLRRRCFWCAYKLDRLVMTSFDLPPSIPDNMITVRPYANLDDRTLLQSAASTSADVELVDSPYYTSVSSSLHILQCRRIQSEILAINLRADYLTQYEHAPEWRIRILAELENYKARVQKYSDPQSKGYTSQRWLAMIYHYTLLMLYRPTKQSVLGPAGDWSVQASTQACLMFRKTQMDRQIAQPWLGLVVQFQAGITLLYCFWATPPEHRTENYDSLDVPDALRACSNIVAIMADRWAKADCLRDVFELLAREIPLVDRPSRPPTRVSEKTIEAIRSKLNQVRALIVHRSIMRMIEEMISEDFPRTRAGNDNISQGTPPQPQSELASGPYPPMPNQMVQQTPSSDMMFQLPFTAPQSFSFDGQEMDTQELNTETLLSFPSVFEFDSWS